ncbi:unnamed protein product [Merluccius merluccius]
MSVLRESRRYGLASGVSRHNVSVFHVKLTDTAARALDALDHMERITVPCSESGEDTKTFTFALTSMVRHIPHGSFDCVCQSEAAGGQLSGVGAVQQRLTVNATDESYQKVFENMAQVVEESQRKSAAIAIKDTGRVRKKRVTVRAPAPALVSLARPRPAGHSLQAGTQRRRLAAGGARGARAAAAAAGVGGGAAEAAAAKRPIRERLVHLLAVRPYRRPELILRLRRDGLTDGEKDSLDALLLEVGQLNSRDKTLVLKDRLFAEVQKDWPGYSPGDQQLLRRTLVRRLFKPHKSLLSVPDTQVSPLRDTPNSSPTRPHKVSLQEERTPSTASANKKPRVSHLSSGRGVAVTTGDRPAPAPTPPPPPPPPPKQPASRSDDRLEAAGDVTVTTENDRNNNKNNNNNNGKESPALLPRPGPPPPQAATAAAAPPLDGPQTDCRRVKKRRKSRHRDREQKVRSRDKKERTADSLPGDLKIKGTADCTDSQTLYDSHVLRASGDGTDYLSSYTAIRGQEQRLSYKRDFNEEYSEYRGLHARIDGVTRQFMKLNTQLKQLQHGSNKYKSNPNYNQDKIRCEYLHNKLAHIKKIISVYDQRQFGADSP